VKIAIDSFRGEVPRITPRGLPPNAAQEATNCRLQTGDLESWRQFALTKTLAQTTTPVQTIYLLKDKWLSWNDQVDVARGVIQDNDWRTYLTCPDLYDEPRFTTYALATTGAEPFPVVTRPIGVPAPGSRPTVVLSSAATPDPTVFNILVDDDHGDLLETAWEHSPKVPYSD